MAFAFSSERGSMPMNDAMHNTATKGIEAYQVTLTPLNSDVVASCSPRRLLAVQRSRRQNEELHEAVPLS